MKRCTTCHAYKPLTEYHNNTHSQDGKGWVCKSCQSAYAKAYHQKIKQFGKSPQLSTEERFWSKIEKNSSNLCWPWLASKDNFGYGLFNINHKCIRSHRMAWELTYGIITDQQCILHHCDNPSCCRPDHLFLGTRTDNSKDKTMKGRVPNEFSLPHTKTSFEDRAKIVLMYQTGKYTQKQLAVMFSISPSRVSYIVKYGH